MRRLQTSFLFLVPVLVALCPPGTFPAPAAPTAGNAAELERKPAEQERAPGPEHPDPAHTLHREAALRIKRGDFAGAEPLLKRALEIREKALGPEHPGVASTLNGLGETYRRQARFDEAEPLLRRALAIGEKSLGPDHPRVAVTLNNLAALLGSRGRHDEAERLYRRVLASWEKTYGPDHPLTATALNNLASVHQKQARYDEAESLLKRALAIREKALGPDHADTAASLNNLAGLHEGLARYAQAEPLLLRALAIWEKTLGPDHPLTAAALNNLAGLYKSLGRNDKAELLFRRVLDIREKTLGPDHPGTAEALNNLAVSHAAREQYAEAAALHRRALAIWEKALGPDHPGTASGLNNLAFALVGRAGDDKADGETLAEAEALYRRALAIREKALGPDHPDTAAVLNNLASPLKKRGQDDQAEALYRRVLVIAALSGKPELLWAAQGNLGALHEQSAPDLAIFHGKRAVNALQETRTANLDMDMAAQRSLLRSHEGHYTHLADLLFARNRLAEGGQVLDMLKEAEYHEFSGKGEGDDPRRTRAAFTPREAKWDGRFRELAERLRAATPGGPEDAAVRRDFDVFFDEVKAAFAPDAPGEPNRLDNVSPLRKPLGELGGPGGEAVLIQYLMPENRLWLLVTTKDGMMARRVDIKADALKEKITAFRGAVISRNPEVNKQGRELFDLLIKPAADVLKTAKTLMLAPDGALRYLPFAALHDGEQYLVQRYVIANFTDMTKDHITDPPAPEWTFAGFGVSRGGEGLSALPAVTEELEGIRDEAIPGVIRLDGDFTRAALREALRRSPPVAHLASHFVFRKGDEQASYLLTGDGRLTLAEIRADYRFDNVDLVALSACETGVGGGEDENGREVEGLGVLVQRQGAKGVLASLWPVNDASTGQFMRLFYGFRRHDKLTKAQALQKAQLAFIEKRVDAALAEVSRNRGGRGGALPAGTSVGGRVKAETGMDQPFYWAPFILMGNWR